MTKEHEVKIALRRAIYELSLCKPGRRDQDEADIAGAIELAKNAHMAVAGVEYKPFDKHSGGCE